LLLRLQGLLRVVMGNLIRNRCRNLIFSAVAADIVLLCNRTYATGLRLR
jgi:hypothetical protein